MTRARARADRRRRRDPLRPPDPAGCARRRARRTPSCVYVGKEPGAAGDAAGGDQRAARRARARAGKRVVRLKGGDPFVFGRGGEEAEALRAAGCPVRGRARASPPASPRPPTRASRSPTATPPRAVAFVTGHEDPDKPESALDWDALARFPGTLVFYMGVKNLPLIAERLIAARARPAASRPRWWSAARCPDSAPWSPRWPRSPHRAEAEGIRAPAITVVGAGRRAARDARLARAAARCTAQVVAVTRARAQASGLAARLRELGAEVVEAPAIRIEPRPLEGDAARRRRSHRRVRARLPHEPERRAAALRRAGEPARTPARSPARPSPRSARARPPSSRGTGSRADVRARARSSPRRWSRRSRPCRWRARACWWRAPPRRATCCPTRCASAGPSVDDVALYETVAEPLGDAERAALERATYVTFTSSSTVRFFLELGGARPPDGARVVSIGPITSATAAGAGPHGARRGRAARHRRPGGRADRRCGGAQGSRVIVTPPHRLRPRRRVRGRLPRRDPHHPPRGRRSWTSPTASSRYDVRHGALVLRNTLPYMPVGRARGRRGPAGGHRAPRAWRCAPATGASWSGPTTAC